MQLIVIEVFVALAISAGSLIGLMVIDVLAERRQHRRRPLPRNSVPARASRELGSSALLTLLFVTLAGFAGAHLGRN